MAYAELHCHTNFSFLDGASAPDELVERAAELGLTGLAVTDHQGLYGVVRFATAARGGRASTRSSASRSSCSTRSSPDPAGVVVPAPAARPARRPAGPADPEPGVDGRRGPARPAATGSGPAAGPSRGGQGGPARHRRAAARPAPRPAGPGRLGLSEPLPARLAGEPGRDEGRAAVPRGARSPSTPRASSRCRAVARARSRGGCGSGDRDGARAAAAVLAETFPAAVPSSSCRTTSCPTTTGSSRSRWRSPASCGCRSSSRTTSTTRRPEGREFQDVLTAIRHGRTLETLADLRRPDGESYLKSEAELLALPPGDGSLGRDVARAWAEGIEGSAALAASCSVDLGFEQYRFPGFPVPPGETPFSYLSELCWAGARKRYHPLTSAVVNAARPRARRHRAGRPRRVLPDLLGPDALREGAGHPGPGPGQRDQLDRVVHARDQPGRADPAQPAVRAVHQRGPDDLSGRRHRLQLGAARGGHPVHLPALRPRAHRDGLQPRDVPGAVGGPRGRLRAGVPAAARRPRGEGARDVRQRDGPARPRGRRRLRRVLPAAGRGPAGRGGRRARGGGARLRRRDGPAEREVRGRRRGARRRAGPAEHPAAARRQGAAVEAAAQAGRPECAAAVRLAARRGGGGGGQGAVAGADFGGTETSGGRRDHKPVRTAPFVQEAVPRRRLPPPPGSGDFGESEIGPSKSGMWEGAPESPPAIRPGGRHDDEGGPGDTPASVAWLRTGRGTGYAADRDKLVPPALVQGRAIDPESGMPEPPPRQTDRLGRPNHWDPPAPRTQAMGRGGSDARSRASSPSRRRSRAAGRRSTSPTGSAGSSSAPGSTASRATSRSTPAGCS